LTQVSTLGRISIKKVVIEALGCIIICCLQQCITDDVNSETQNIKNYIKFIEQENQQELNCYF